MHWLCPSDKFFCNAEKKYRVALNGHSMEFYLAASYGQGAPPCPKIRFFWWNIPQKAKNRVHNVHPWLETTMERNIMQRQQCPAVSFTFPLDRIPLDRESHLKQAAVSPNESLVQVHVTFKITGNTSFRPCVPKINGPGRTNTFSRT